ncbi:hypothetical protein DY000_02015976 [Brassica cretica]|uniref:Uncharacterized protein n=1 Tax=Brassica cretica TaxID=69181 RepID=A0ABQ7CM92_BRACR|nr:hypothetical protein DY000_02015976 [Brassica cretica]
MGKKRPREHTTTPSTLDQSRVGRRVIRGLEIRTTTRMSSAIFIKPAATQPLTAKFSAQDWLQNCLQENSPMYRALKTSSANWTASRETIRLPKWKPLSKVTNRVKSAEEGKT